MCFSCICLFILHPLIFVLFLFLLVSGLAAASVLWHSLDFSVYFRILPLLMIFSLVRAAVVWAISDKISGLYPLFEMIYSGALEVLN